jgi:hypothetical protein
MNNRREFLKKGAIAGIVLSGISASNSELTARDIVDTKNSNTTVNGGNAYTSIHFETYQTPEILLVKAIKIFNRVLFERTGTDFTKPGNNCLTINLKIVAQSMPPEAFRIEKGADHQITLTSGDPNGILYGIGKLLHTSLFTDSGFIPGSWQGLSVPEKPQRNIYFATHFHNFYHTAPVEKVVNYIEELALWGYNNIEVWFDMHGFEGINDPKAVVMLDRLSVILRGGKDSGMKITLCMLANEGYNSSPPELRAKAPKQIRLRGCYGVEICPSQPGGTELILKQIEEELNAFSSRGATIDFIVLWPYDQGGCGCDLCTPWGSNGYLKLSRKITGLVHQKIPGSKIILSTWLFDCVEDEGEWAGVAKAFIQEKPWVDYIQADSHETFPRYIMNNPVPGNLPLLNFPEISMWESWPWGGFGANPLPDRFQRLWNEVKDKVAGGAPYSEGIFEDINKVIYSQFYWNSDKPAIESVREYVSYEFSSEYADSIVEAITIMEKNHGMRAAYKPGFPVKIKVPETDYGASKAYNLLKGVDTKLSQRTRQGWRWRILLLRAMFDFELRQGKGVPNEAVEAGFLELSLLYHAQNADASVRPPAK